MGRQLFIGALGLKTTFKSLIGIRVINRGAMNNTFCPGNVISTGLGELFSNERIKEKPWFYLYNFCKRFSGN